MQSLQQFILSVSSFINGVLIPFLFALALLFFIFHTFRYYIKDAGEDKEKAKNLALYGVAAFVILVSIWGLVNLLMSGLGLRQNEPLSPDYFGTTRSGSGDANSFFRFTIGISDNTSNSNVRENNFWDN